MHEDKSPIHATPKKYSDKTIKSEVNVEEVVRNAKHKKTPIFSKTNNHQLIKNAIEKVCLPGEVNRKQREEALTELHKLPKKNLIVLFKDAVGTRQDFKALYSLNEEEETAELVYGPKDAYAVLDNTMVKGFYRYNSGAREFRNMPGNKSLSIAVDAVSLKPQLARRKHKLF
eukprot:TRINITY_DN1186_c0_g1_i23.p1 TRINITY_DN1186_c0_g1~~TRINITY_DN1186_c0_g1_i23.p1  ORF type:complete len:172 (+),score=47.41 TRINITY_DN1186_c0_g1_i23:165-680(+)